MSWYLSNYFSLPLATPISAQPISWALLVPTQAMPQWHCASPPQQCTVVFLILGMPQAMSPLNTEEQFFSSINMYWTPDTERDCAGRTGCEDIQGIQDPKARKTQAGGSEKGDTVLNLRWQAARGAGSVVLVCFYTATFPGPKTVTSPPSRHSINIFWMNRWTRYDSCPKEACTLINKKQRLCATVSAPLGQTGWEQRQSWGGVRNPGPRHWVTQLHLLADGSDQEAKHVELRPSLYFSISH